MLLFWYLGGEMRQHEEVELLLKGYHDDLQEMQIELRSMLAEIEDTRKYASTHQVIIFFSLSGTLSYFFNVIKIVKVAYFTNMESFHISHLM